MKTQCDYLSVYVFLTHLSLQMIKFHFHRPILLDGVLAAVISSTMSYIHMIVTLVTHTVIFFFMGVLAAVSSYTSSSSSMSHCSFKCFMSSCCHRGLARLGSASISFQAGGCRSCQMNSRKWL